jgi:imidazolonepropionase
MMMREPYPDARRFIDAGITVAIATDCNPGTSNVETMPFVIALAAASCGMTPGEALWSATAGGAAALGLEDRGVLAPGMLADMVILDAPTFEHLAYRPDANLIARVVKRGRLV